ncbi:MAG TPA: type 1 glutamine amidotransferase [Actinomycetota bacterium]|nr:type 1 glutamine amidotransferase [Actinomycetota bacterium]
MRPLLLVRNDPFETFGVAPRALADVGAETQVWEAVDGQPPPPLDDVSGVIVFGSSYNIEHADERPFIEHAAAMSRACVERGVPLLGVCFGAQLLAWGLGARVFKAETREVGFEPIVPTPSGADDDVLAHYRAGDRVFQWHMDTFELPDGAELLATGERVTNQAFRVGPAAWGVQFHFEIDASEIALWLDEFAKQGDLERDWGKTAAQVQDEQARYLADHERKGAEVFRRFAQVARRAATGVGNAAT